MLLLYSYIILMRMLKNFKYKGIFQITQCVSLNNMQGRMAVSSLIVL